MRPRPIVIVNAETGRFAIRTGVGRYCVAQAIVNGDWVPRLGEDVIGDLWHDGPAQLSAAGGVRNVEVIACRCSIDVIRNELLT